MKKAVLFILSLSLLLSVLLCPLSVSAAEDDALTVKVYDVMEDIGALYLVFSEPVQAPPSDFALSLCGHGWPVSGEDGEQILRWLVRSSLDHAEVITNTIWRVYYSKALNDMQRSEYKSWVLGTCQSIETDPASVDEWAFRIFGVIRSADGSKQLPLDIDLEVLNDNATEYVNPSYYAGDPAKTDKVGSIYDLGVPKETEAVPETSAPKETEPKATEAPKETEAPKATDAPAESKAPAADTKAPEEKKGCGSSVAALALLPMMLAAGVVCKKH